MWLTLNGGASPPRVVQVHGDIDLASAARLRDQLTELLHRHTPHLVIDLSEITFCDAGGLTALLATARRAELLGGELVLASPTPHLQKLLRLTGLDTVFCTYPTVPAAVAGPAGASIDPALPDPATTGESC
jgi:anti-sigma B factor antagonist